MKVIVQDVEVRIRGEWESFITPKWDSVLLFYPNWQRAVKAAGYKPYEIPPYMMEVAKQLPTRGGTRTPDDWIKRYFEHFGLDHLASMTEASKLLEEPAEKELEPRMRQLKRLGFDWMFAVSITEFEIDSTHDERMKAARIVYATPWRRIPRSLIKKL